MVNTRNYPSGVIDHVLRGKDGARRVTFRYDLLDHHDIKKDELDGITEAIVTHDSTGAVKRTARFRLNDYARKEINFLADRILPWFVLHMPDGGTVQWPLGIFLPGTPAREVSGAVTAYDISAFDRTLILEEYKLPHRQFFSKGTRYTAAVSRLLNMAGLVKVNIEDCGLELAADIEFPIGTSGSEAVGTLLDAINYESVFFDADGCAWARAYVPQEERGVTIAYTADRHSVIAPEFIDSLDTFGQCNVFVRTAENTEEEIDENQTPFPQELRSVFVNDDPNSPLSTVNRGRRITDFGTVEIIANQETLDAMVKRIAIESTSSYRYLTFQTALMPIHGNMETLYLDIPDVLETPMKFIETAWEMELRTDGVMRHEAKAVVHL